MPNNGRTSDDENGRIDPRKSVGAEAEALGSVAARGGEAITATLTGAVEQVTRDVSETGSKLVDAVDHAVGDAAGEAARSIAHGAEATSDALHEATDALTSKSPESNNPGDQATIAPDDTNPANATPANGAGHAGEASNDAPAAPASAAQVAAGSAVAAVGDAARPARSRLRDAMRRARQNEVERSDVIVDLRETELARLELLAESVEDVFAELPESTDLFDGRVTPGDPPRMWIDVLAYVAMGRDKRTYQFVQETRHGRKVVSETGSLDAMGKQVTQYIAHRMVERERALLSDQPAQVLQPGPEADATPRTDADQSEAGAVQSEAVAMADQNTQNGKQADNAEADNADPGSAVAKSAAAAGAAAATGAAVAVAASRDDERPGYSGFALIVAFLLGMVAGAIALFLIGANYVPPV
jgi:hypothetical protein